jgi:chemotaxis protein MotB
MGAPGHADDWLMTYADMITLLLCFFAIIIAVTVAKKDVTKAPEPAQQIVEETKPAIVQKAVQKAEIRPTPQPAPELPDVFASGKPFHPLTAADFPVVPAPELPLMKAEEPAPEVIMPMPIVPLLAVADVPPIKTPTAPLPAVDQPTPLPPLADNLKPPGAVVEQKGDRLTTIEMSSAAFFESGSAELSVPGKVILGNLALNLKSDKFRDYQITVEGHTDDQPIHTTQFPSNWELSTARASAVVHFFLEEGIAADKLRAAGYADTFPKAPNRDADGRAIPENQAQNRRVVIKLEKIEKTG